MFTPEVYQVGTRWAYAILQNGWPIIRQEYHPDKPGDEPMTQEEAEECAAIVLGRMENPTSDPLELNKTDFINLFTHDELADLLDAAKTIPAVAVYQYKLDQASVVRLNDPDILTGLPALEAIGLLSPGRAAKILRNEAP
jgi:hypothetical protein